MKFSFLSFTIIGRKFERKKTSNMANIFKISYLIRHIPVYLVPVVMQEFQQFIDKSIIFIVQTVYDRF